MALKFVAVLCVSVVLAQGVCGQALNAGFGPGNGCNNGYAANGYIGNSLNGNLGYNGNLAYNNGNLLASNSAGSPSFNVVSGSTLNPSGISVLSNTEITGEIDVNGALPYASAVAVEGTVQTAGDSSVNYGCGSNVALNSAGSPAGLPNNGFNPGFANGLNAGLANGLNAGFANGLNAGLANGLNAGIANGLNAGIPNSGFAGLSNNGLSAGFANGLGAGNRLNGPSCAN